MQRNKNLTLAQDVQGFLTNREGRMLYALASSCQGHGALLEIGSWQGKSTIWIAQALKDNKKNIPFYAIDPHTGSPEHQSLNAKVWTFEKFENNLKEAGLFHLVTPLVRTSEEARQTILEPLEFIFIDGAHEFEAVDLDYRLWEPLLIIDGHLAFHDTPWPGVACVIERVFKHDGFHHAYFTDCLMVGQKTNHVNFKERLKNYCMLFLNNQFQRTCHSHAPKTLRTLYKNILLALREVIYHC